MESETAQRLFPRLRLLRKALGLTQEQLAERAGLTYKHYQAIERGTKLRLQLPTLVKLATGFGLEVWQLFHPTAGEIAVAERQANYGPVPDTKQRGKRRKDSLDRPLLVRARRSYQTRQRANHVEE